VAGAGDDAGDEAVPAVLLLTAASVFFCEPPKPGIEASTPVCLATAVPAPRINTTPRVAITAGRRSWDQMLAKGDGMFSFMLCLKRSEVSANFMANLSQATIALY
jgi:hypothetical protein